MQHLVVSQDEAPPDDSVVAWAKLPGWFLGRGNTIHSEETPAAGVAQAAGKARGHPAR
jgi:hypothetical protein